MADNYNEISEIGYSLILDSVIYKGENVGRNWTFTFDMKIDFGNGPTSKKIPVPMQIAVGETKPKLNMIIIGDKFDLRKSTPPVITGTIRLEEKGSDEKYPDKAQVDLPSLSSPGALNFADEKEFSVSAEVREDRGPKSKAKKLPKATLTFKLIYKLRIPKDNPCMFEADTPLNVPSIRDLSQEEVAQAAVVYSQNTGVRTRFLGATIAEVDSVKVCIFYVSTQGYKACITSGKARVRWGVDNREFVEATVPPANDLTFCPRVADQILYLQNSIIKGGVPINSQFIQNAWYMEVGVIAHELVHVKDYTESLIRSYKTAQLFIQREQLNLVGSPPTQNDIDAKVRELEEKYLGKWAELFDFLIKSYRHEPAFQAAVPTLQKRVDELKAWQKATKCPF